jgi:hypothetical protein
VSQICSLTFRPSLSRYLTFCLNDDKYVVDTNGIVEIICEFVFAELHQNA